MPSLLEGFMNNPATILGLSVLSNNKRPAEGLLQGSLLQNRLAAGRAGIANQGLRGQLMNQQILAAQQASEARKARNKLFTDFRGTPGQEAAGPTLPGAGLLMAGGTGAQAATSPGGGQITQPELAQFANVLAANPETSQQGISLLSALKPSSAASAEAERLIAQLPSDEQPAARAARLNKLTNITESSSTSEFERLIAGLPESEKTKLRADRANSLAGRITDRAAAVQDRADVNAKLRERGLNISQSRLEETISQNVRGSSNTLRDDFESRAKPLREQIRALDKLDVVLSGDINALDNKAVTNLLSQVLNTNVRAQAELNSFANFGDLSERISGSLSTFFTGVRTQSQIDQVRGLVKQMRGQMFNPGISELEKAYEATAIRNDLNPSDVVIKGASKGKFANMSVEQLRNVNIDNLSLDQLDQYEAAISGR